GLLLRSFSRLLDVELGFDPARVITARVALSPARYSLPTWRSFHERLLERVRALPEVELAALNSAVPLNDAGAESSVLVEGRPVGPHGPDPESSYQVVTPGYFQVMGVQLLRGRLLEPRDDTRDVPVAVVDQSFVDRLFPHADPIGKRIAFEFRG